MSARHTKDPSRGAFAAGAFALAVALGGTGCNIPAFSLAVEPLFETYGPLVAIAEFAPDGRFYRTRVVPGIVRNDTGWRQVLPPSRFGTARRGATEVAFSGRYDDFYEHGIYHCAACGTEVFRSEDKFNSGTGWPSFRRPIAETNVNVSWDRSWGVRRRAVTCARCGSHLGHVFNDGPPPTLRRYCVNSMSLGFSDADRPTDRRAGDLSGRVQARISSTTRP